MGGGCIAAQRVVGFRVWRKSVHENKFNLYFTECALHFEILWYLDPSECEFRRLFAQAF